MMNGRGRGERERMERVERWRGGEGKGWEEARSTSVIEYKPNPVAPCKMLRNSSVHPSL